MHAVAGPLLAVPQLLRQQVQVTGDGTAINNLYGRFCQDGVHDKPMVITETSAFWLPSITVGVSDLQIKSAWWEQVSSRMLLCYRADICGIYATGCLVTIRAAERPWRLPPELQPANLGGSGATNEPSKVHADFCMCVVARVTCMCCV